jgi:hypothetical protein
MSYDNLDSQLIYDKKKDESDKKANVFVSINEWCCFLLQENPISTKYVLCFSRYVAALNSFQKLVL